MLSQIFTTDQITSAAEVFKAFGNPVRIRIIDALIHRNLRVMELAELLGCPQPIVSQQLKILRNAGIVDRLRDGVSSRYTLADPHFADMIRCMSGCLVNRS